MLLKKYEIGLFFFNCNSFFQKVQRITLSTVETTGSPLQDALMYHYFCFRPILATIFGEKKNRKAETNKTQTTIGDLKKKSRFRYIKIWVCSISLRKHVQTLLKFKNI